MTFLKEEIVNYLTEYFTEFLFIITRKAKKQRMGTALWNPAPVGSRVIVRLPHGRQLCPQTSGAASRRAWGA